MTGPGAEEEIQEYGEHYCACGDEKYWGDPKCSACKAEDEIIQATNEDRIRTANEERTKRSRGLLAYLPDGFIYDPSWVDLPEVDGVPQFQKPRKI